MDKEKSMCHDREEDGKPSGEERDSCRFDEDRYKKQRERYRRQAENAISRYWRQGRKDRFAYTPWLVIRYGSGDFGLRPIPGSVAHWKSPDIWVESSDPDGNAVAGEQNFVHARIFNLGMAKAMPVKVDYYWANPALGLGPANMNLIGTEWVEVRSQFSRDVKCSTPWVPVHVNNGHECLMVNCSNPILDPITAPFEPRVDRHVGQRNITVLQGQAGANLAFRLELNNIFPLAMKTTVFTRARHITVTKTAREKLKPTDLVNGLAAFGAPLPAPIDIQAMLRPGTVEYRNAGTAVRLAGSAQMTNKLIDTGFRAEGSTPRVSGSVSETRTRLLSATSGRSMANLLLAREKMALDGCFPRPNFYKFQEITMEAFESRHLDVELGIPHGAKPGEYITFHFEQWAEDMALGGYSVIVQITKDDAKECGCK